MHWFEDAEQVPELLLLQREFVLDDPPLMLQPDPELHGSLEQLNAPISMTKKAAAIILFIGIPRCGPECSSSLRP